MAAVLKPGTLVAQYKLIELAGDGTQSNIYLAEREPEMHWLIQIEDPNWDPDVAFANLDYLTIDGAQWVALPTAGTTAVNLASWVDRLELPFIGWRWANLGRELGHLHARGVVLQQNQPLALERLEFTRSGELSLMQGRTVESAEYTFPPPDPADALTAASDVYALGASLKALAGENLPKGVQNVLDRATNPVAARRYADATQFAEALAQVLPDPQREKVAPPRPKRSLLQVLAIAGVVLCLGLALCMGLLYVLGLSLLPAVAPTVVAIRPERLRVTILDWQMLQGCSARANVRVEDHDQPVTPDAGVSFFAISPLATIHEIDLAPGSAPDSTELHFELGDFCIRGGALSIGARRELREGKSTVFYYPPDEDIPENVALFKPGGSQARINKSQTSYLNFGLVGLKGGPANLKGAIKIRLLQNGIPVPDPQLKFVNGDTDPLVAVLVMDTSKSMVGDALTQAQAAAVDFVDQLGTKDTVCIYRFASEVSEFFACSPDKQSASAAIKTLTAGGNTALYQALVRVGELHSNPNSRQAIILLSDGADNISQVSREQALKYIVGTNIPVYAIGLRNQDLAPAVLQEIAARTAGEYLEAPGPDALVGLYKVLQQRLDNQYVVEFENLFPDQSSGTLELIVSDGAGETIVKKDYRVGE